MTEEASAKDRMRRARSDVMKKGFLIYFLGLASGMVLLGLLLILWQIGEGFGRWGETVVYSDAEVRKAIEELHIKLPEGARDLRYAINGFQEHTVWIRFTVPKDQLWKTVQDNILREKQHLQPELPEPLRDDIPQDRDQHLDLSWWNPKEVWNPLSGKKDERQEKRYFEQWLVDEDKSAVSRMSGDY
jgi:hypothetical protein